MRIRLLGIFIAALAACMLAGPAVPEAAALSTSSFRPGHIIDDAIFTNHNAMSVQDIQNFLNSKVPSCDTYGSKLTTRSNGSGGFYTRAQWGALNGEHAPYVCLRDYVENPDTKQNNYKAPGTPISGGQSAAQIIWNASQTYRINPQVILTTLQKEQGLITDDWPWSDSYRAAMGYGCPDTAACNSKYYGFFNQVDNAAWQFRYYLDHPGAFNYTVGNNFIRYNPQSSCGGSVVNIENMATAALYIYTPYQPNDAALKAGYAAAPPCGAYGNRNFWLYFNEWFGSTLMPHAFRASNSETIYMYISGYKIIVPAMGILQDYSISPAAVKVLDPTTVAAVATPTPESGISPSLSYIVKSTSDADADGGSVYLMSVGKKYSVQTMQQFYDFGYIPEEISYLPLGFLQNFPGSQSLSSFVKTPAGSVFKMAGGQKRLIFDYQTYISQNPSDFITYVSYFVAERSPSGMPLANKEILIKYADSAGVYLLANGTYHAIPTFDAYQCWGFETTLKTPLFTPWANSYIAPISPASSLQCTYADGSGTNYLLGRSSRFALPAEYGITAAAASGDLQAIAAKIPASGAPLKQYIKPEGASSIWYLEQGKRRPVPTYSNFELLGIRPHHIDTVHASAFSAIPAEGFKLATGQAVKTPDSPVVYSINGSSRVAFERSDDFLGYRNTWLQIETYPTAELDAQYPFQNVAAKPYIYNSDDNKVYLADPYGCYRLSDDIAARHGVDKQALIASGQTAANFPRLQTTVLCNDANAYVKQHGHAVVYWLNEGKKHPIDTWTKLVEHSGRDHPYIPTISEANLARFPLAEPL